jgi:hypothetical protein
MRDAERDRWLLFRDPVEVFWAIHLYASQFSNPVCRLGDAILYQVPGTLIKDFIVPKTAWNALRFPGIWMIHQLEM